MNIYKASKVKAETRHKQTLTWPQETAILNALSLLYRRAKLLGPALKTTKSCLIHKLSTLCELNVVNFHLDGTSSIGLTIDGR